MLKLEKTLIDIALRNVSILIIAITTIAAVAVRISMIDFVSGDMQVYLIPWFDEIKEAGGFKALKSTVGNYNLPYQSMIAFLTVFPMNPIYLYKISSSIFDFASGIIVYRIVKETKHDDVIASISYSLTILLPTVIFNSSLWGQCDSIYSYFCLVSLYFCLKEKYRVAFIFTGVAFAFKLQTIFFLPFLCFMYLYKKTFSGLNLLWIPIMVFILSIIGLIQGQPITNLFFIYYNQATVVAQRMSNCYPSLWNIIVENYSENYYIDLHLYAIVFTAIILVILLSFMLRYKKQFSNIQIIEICFLLTYTCVFFLPNMHERYGYLYVIIGLLACVLDKKMIPVFITIELLDMAIYGNYLFHLSPNWQMISIVNILCYVISIFIVMDSILKTTGAINSNMMKTFEKES